MALGTVPPVMNDAQRIALADQLVPHVLSVYNDTARVWARKYGIEPPAPDAAASKVRAYVEQRSQLVQEGINQRIQAGAAKGRAQETIRNDVTQYNRTALVPYLSHWAAHQGVIDVASLATDTNGIPVTDGELWEWTQNTEYVCPFCTAAADASPAKLGDLLEITNGRLPPVHAHCDCACSPSGQSIPVDYQKPVIQLPPSVEAQRTPNWYTVDGQEIVGLPADAKIVDVDKDNILPDWVAANRYDLSAVDRQPFRPDLPNYYRVNITPRPPPNVASFDEAGEHVVYDADIAARDDPTVPNPMRQVVLQPNIWSETNPLEAPFSLPANTVYRATTFEELKSIIRTGQIPVQGELVSDPGVADNGLAHLGPLIAPTFDRPAYILAIDLPAGMRLERSLPFGAGRIGELSTPLPATAIRGIVLARPYVMVDGSFDLRPAVGSGEPDLYVVNERYPAGRLAYRRLDQATLGLPTHVEPAPVVGAIPSTANVGPIAGLDKPDSAQEDILSHPITIDMLEPLGGGINESYEVAIPNPDGTESRYAVKPRPNTNDRPRYAIPPGHDPEREEAAYLVNRAMGGLVDMPAVVTTNIEGIGDYSGTENGDASTVMNFIHGAETYRNASNSVLLDEEQDAAVFDAVIGNLDRHGENALVRRDPLENQHILVAIDHGLSFPESGKSISGNEIFLDAYGGSELSLPETEALQRLVAAKAVITPQLEALVGKNATESMWQRVTAMMQNGRVPESVESAMGLSGQSGRWG